jgi:PASTA domain
MALNALSLPVDIPWKRLCVSRDMLDPSVCDRQFPYRWRSSLAVFSYEPPEDQQAYDDMTVSYLKVACTITGYQPDPEEVGLLDRRPWVAWQESEPLADYVEKVSRYYGCYGAILEVGVKAGPAGSASEDLAKFPYFINFEPKKREIYELVTETGEMVSRSLAAVNLMKGTTTTQSHEVLDTGSVEGNLGVSVGVVEVGIGGAKKSETKDMTQVERQNVRTADQQREMRELLSHQTQLTQMYNEFTSYHLGTNRAVFFMLPRPHIFERPEKTFVNGPRALEGIQEVLLVVMRPKSLKEMCVEAYLETAHVGLQEDVFAAGELTEEAHSTPIGSKEIQTFYDLGMTGATFSAWAQVHFWASKFEGYSTDPKSGAFLDIVIDRALSFPIPAGSELDTDRPDKGFRLTVVPPADGFQHVAEAEIDESASGIDQITVRARLGLAGQQSTALSGTGTGFSGTGSLTATFGEMLVNLTLYLRRTGAKKVDLPNMLYLTGRGVCCCPPQHVEREFPVGTFVTYEGAIASPVKPFLYSSGQMSLRDANRLRYDIGRQVQGSFSAPGRYAFGTVRFAESQFVGQALARSIASPDHPDNVPAADMAHLEETLSGRVRAASANLRRADVLRLQLAELADRLGLTHEEAVTLRRAGVGLAGPPPRGSMRWARPGSKEGKECAVPELRGLTLTPARQIAHRSGFEIGAVEVADSEQPAGVVLRQQPAAGTVAIGGSPIQLTAASGLSVKIPDIVGKTMSEAFCALREAGLRREPDLTMETADQPGTRVLSVSPEERTYVTPNALVSLRVAGMRPG